MKNLMNFKKFGAALTAVAMLGTLSTGVFAAEIDEIVEAPVIESVEIDVPIIPVDVEEVEDVDATEDVDIPEDVVEEVELMTTGSGSVVDLEVDVTKTSDITITDVTATKYAIGEETLYNVTLTYEMTYQAAAPQITLLSYLFADASNIPEAEDVAESNVKAVDQKTHVEKSADNTKSIGEINFLLSTIQDGVDDNAKLVLIVGTDADLTNANAQAVAISLASAVGEDSEEEPPAITGVYGDADCDGDVDGDDWITVFNHRYRIVVNDDLNDNTTRAFKSADIDKDGDVDGDDWIAIFNYRYRIETSDVIGTEF